MNVAASDSPQPTDKLPGLIDRVTYFNEATGFAVLKVKSRRATRSRHGRRLSSLSQSRRVADRLRNVGPQSGILQLKATVLQTVPPDTAEGISEIFGQRNGQGIGAVFAKRMVERFGADILSVIEHRSGELETVEGIGPKRRLRIRQAWEERKAVREIMLFLHGHGVSTSKAVRI